MKKGRKTDSYSEEVAGEKKVHADGRPWKVVHTVASFEEADKQRKKLIAAAKKNDTSNLEVKVRRSNETGRFTVRTRECDTPKQEKKKNEQ